MSTAPRGNHFDREYLSKEPPITPTSTTTDYVRAYNWYNYSYTSEDAKTFTLAYLKKIKYDPDAIKALSGVEHWRFGNIGWNSKILTKDGYLSDDVKARMWIKIEALVMGATKASVTAAPVVAGKNVINIQDRINSKASEMIGDIEAELDKFLLDTKYVFDAKKWFHGRGIKSQVATAIAAYYKGLYSEVFDALEGKDVQLKEAYSRWKKPALKAYLDILRDIISQSDVQVAVAKVIRKPRKKKVKPATDIVKKLRFKAADDEYGLKGVEPAGIIGASQLWVFNTKYRTISVYNALGETGLSVKGSTLTGFDEKTAITKKLRKPKDQIKLLLESGKVGLRKYMDAIRCKPKAATGRINSDTVLIKVIK